MATKTLTARKIFQYAWTIVDTTIPEMVEPQLGFLWEQLWRESRDGGAGYKDTVLRIARTMVGGEDDRIPGIQITTPHEDPELEWVVFTAGIWTPWRKSIIGGLEEIHGFSVKTFAPGLWCAHLETLGKRAKRVMAARRKAEEAQRKEEARYQAALARRADHSTTQLHVVR